jgi:DNA-binding NarL/FixJ family response regulator
MESPTLPGIDPGIVPARRTRRAERLLVLMDDTLMRAIVLASLETAPSLDVVAVTGSEAEAIDLLSDGRLDIVLLDGEADRLPALVHRVEALAGTSSARIVCFVSSGDARRIGALLRAGAESCVATSVAPDDLATVVREASRGTIFHAPPTSLDHGMSEAPAPLVSGLTHRELEVLTLAAEGLANKQIAQRLWVTPKTIKFHLSNVFRKLDVSNRTEATRQAQRLGLLQVGGRGAAD